MASTQLPELMVTWNSCQELHMKTSKISLVQIMACHLIGAKPLCEPMPEYCLLDPWEENSVKSFGIYKFSLKTCNWKCPLKMTAILSRPQCVNDAIWQHRPGSILARVMARYLSLCSLTYSSTMCRGIHLRALSLDMKKPMSETRLMRQQSVTNWAIKIIISKISLKSSRDQWINN